MAQYSFTTGAIKPSNQPESGAVYFGEVQFIQTPNEDTNTSQVQYWFYAWTTYAGSNYNINTGLDGDHNEVYVTINGVNGAYTSNWGRVILAGTSASNKFLLDSGTRTVTHNSDGTASMPYYCRYKSPNRDAGGNQSVWGNWVVNTTLTLNPIDSNCRLTSVPNVNVGSSHTVTWNYESSKHSGYYVFLEWIVGNTVKYSTTVAASSGSKSYTIPSSWANSFPSSRSFNLIVRATTYKEQAKTNQVGVPSSATCICTIANASPTIASLSITNSESISSGWGVWVKSNSYATATWGAITTVSSATIVSKTLQYYSGGSPVGDAVSVGSGASSGSSALGVVPVSGTVKVRLTVVDSRGYSAYRESSDITVLDYSVPQVDNMSVYRCDENGNEDRTGSYFRVSAHLTVSSCSNNNAKFYYISYKETSASSWTTSASQTMASYDGTFITSAILITTTSAYNIAVQLCDSFHDINNATTSQLTLSTANVFLDILADSITNTKTAIGIGTVASGTSNVTSAWKMNAKGGLDVYDTKITFRDSSGTQIGIVGAGRIVFIKAHVGSASSPVYISNISQYQGFYLVCGNAGKNRVLASTFIPSEFVANGTGGGSGYESFCEMVTNSNYRVFVVFNYASSSATIWTVGTSADCYAYLYGVI